MRFKRLWTLSGLMILIALLAVPLALYARHVQKVARERAEVDLILKTIDKKLRENPQSYACPPIPMPAKLGYFEYGSFEQEAPK